MLSAASDGLDAGLKSLHVSSYMSLKEVAFNPVRGRTVCAVVVVAQVRAES